MLQENLVDFNPFRGILSVSRESDRSNIHVECTVTCDFGIQACIYSEAIVVVNFHLTTHK